MKEEIDKYNNCLDPDYNAICNLIASTIEKTLTEADAKIWHKHPVWFINGNPIVGYSKQKKGLRLMFWSGADFEEKELNVLGEKFKDASIFYNSISEVNVSRLEQWLEKSRIIQWDYKNIVKRKGNLERIE